MKNLHKATALTEWNQARPKLWRICLFLFLNKSEIDQKSACFCNSTAFHDIIEELFAFIYSERVRLGRSRSTNGWVKINSFSCGKEWLKLKRNLIWVTRQEQEWKIRPVSNYKKWRLQKFLHGKKELMSFIKGLIVSKIWIPISFAISCPFTY